MDSRTLLAQAKAQFGQEVMGDPGMHQLITVALKCETDALRKYTNPESLSPFVIEPWCNPNSLPPEMGFCFVREGVGVSLGGETLPAHYSYSIAVVSTNESRTDFQPSEVLRQMQLSPDELDGVVRRFMIYLLHFTIAVERANAHLDSHGRYML